MIRVGRKDVSRIEAVDENGVKRIISKVYTVIDGKLKLVWEAIMSCFGSGFWIKNRPWINNNGWKNN